MRILKNKKLLTIIGLLLYCLVVFLPPVIYGYDYPNIGDDTAVYLERIEAMQGGGVAVQYTGYILSGYPMLYFRDTFGWNMNKQFLWFNFISLALVGITIYCVFSKLVNRKTGWITLLLTLFTAQGVFFLFYYGQIYNIINIGIFLPLTILFAVKYFNKGGKWNLVALIVFTCLYSSFHTNGIYLPAIAGIGTVSYFAYCKIRKKTINKRILFVGGGITLVALSVFVFLVVLPTMNQLEQFSEAPLIDTMDNVGKGMPIPVYHWLMSILSPAVFILLILLAMFYKNIKDSLDDKSKVALVILGITSVVLIIVTFCKISLDPWRQSVDLAVVASMFTGLCFGKLLEKKNIVLSVILVIAIGYGLIHNLPTWFSYNSAMRDIDFQAIEYLEDAETYSCSSQVAFWVYDRYTDCQHKDNDGDYVIMRSEPMTPRSHEDNIWYQFHGWNPSSEYELIDTFEEDGVEIEVWKLMDWAREKRDEMRNYK